MPIQSLSCKQSYPYFHQAWFMVAIAPAMIRTQTRIFGGDVFPTAWIHARRKLLSFWKQNKRSLGSCLVFAWLLHSKATQWAIFSGENPGKPQIRNNGATITDHQPKMLCTPNQMIEAGKRRKGQKHESWMHIRKLSHYGLFFFFLLFFFLLFSLFHKCKYTNSDSE